MTAAARSVWVRALTGAIRAGTTYYWITDPSLPPAWASGMVAIPILEPPQLPAQTIEGLGTVAADSTTSWTSPTSADARLVTAPDLVATGVARRAGLLAAYVAPGDTTIEVTDWTGFDGQVIQIGHELMIAGVIAGTTLPVTRTNPRAHATSVPRPTPVMDAGRVPLAGQYVEIGITTATGDTVLWRGVMGDEPASAGGVTRYTARSLTSLIRDFRPAPPSSVPRGDGRRAVWVPGGFGALLFARDPGQYPGQWPLIRVVARSGDWAILDPSYRTRAFDAVAGYEDEDVSVLLSTVRHIGTQDGVIRITAVSQTVTYRTAAGTRSRVISSQDVADAIAREHLDAVLADLSHVEYASEETSGRAWDFVRPFFGGDVLPPGMTVGLPSAWIEDTLASTRQFYEPSGWPSNLARVPASSTGLGAWLGDGLFAACGWYLTMDMGRVLVESWEEYARDPAAFALDEVECPDRGVPAWSGSIGPVAAVIEVEDPSLSVDAQIQYATGIGSGGRIRHRPTQGGTRTITSTDRVFVAGDTWLDGVSGILTIPARLGLSTIQRQTVNSLLSTWSRQVPGVVCVVRDPGRVIGQAMPVELSDLPVTRRTVGHVYACARNPAAGTATVWIALPGVGREALSLWAPSLLLEDAGTGAVAWDVLAPWPGTVAVYSPAWAYKGTLTGFTIAGTTASWTGGTATPADGDVITLVDAPPGVVPADTDGYVGYVGDVAPATEDGVWQ